MVTVPSACWYGSCYQTNLNGHYSMFKAPAHNLSSTGPHAKAWAILTTGIKWCFAREPW